MNDDVFLGDVLSPVGLEWGEELPDFLDVVELLLGDLEGDRGKINVEGNDGYVG